MRLLLPALAASLVLVLSSCSKGPRETPADLEAWAEAVRLQDQGRLDDALERYRELVRSTGSDALSAKAALEIGRIEVAVAERDRAASRLRALPAQVDVRALEDVLSDVDAVEGRFAGTAFAEPIAAAAAAARSDARRRFEEQRGLQRRTVEELVQREEYAAALDLVRKVESKRTVDDRRDVAEMLALVRTRSDAAADAVLLDFERQQAEDPAKAVAWLDDRMESFRGTRAYARLLTVRLAASPPGDAASAPSAGDGNPSSSRDD